MKDFLHQTPTHAWSYSSRTNSEEHMEGIKEINRIEKVIFNMFTRQTKTPQVLGKRLPDTVCTVGTVFYLHGVSGMEKKFSD